VGLVADRDLVLLHRFEQRALHLGGRAVDLVGQDDLREDRALLRGEGAVAGIVDERADQVGRQEVGRELDTPERPVDRRGERLHRGRLREAGTPSKRTWPFASNPISSRSMRYRCPTMTLPVSSRSR
jgi:hypothetical protein